MRTQQKQDLSFLRPYHYLLWGIFLPWTDMHAYYLVLRKAPWSAFKLANPLLSLLSLLLLFPLLFHYSWHTQQKFSSSFGKETTHPIPFVFIMHMCCYIVVFAKTRQDPPEQSRTAICKEGKGSIVVSAKNIHFDTSWIRSCRWKPLTHWASVSIHVEANSPLKQQ